MDVLESLDMPLIVLASGSPRRQEMLEWTGWDFILRPVNANENRMSGESPVKYVSRLAKTKANAASKCLDMIYTANNDAIVIIGADTTVADGDMVLGKPANEEDARRVLRHLRGRSHDVFTALAVYRVSDQSWLFDNCHSQVTMRDYTDKEIDSYIQTGDPMDKAGAYAIQNRTFHPVTGFTGCFANVMGLPLCHLIRTMRKIGISTPFETALSCKQHLDYDCPITDDVLAGLHVG